MSFTENSIRWKGSGHTSSFGSIDGLFESFDFIGGLQLCWLSTSGLVVALKKGTKRNIYNHLVQQKTEMGGLLIGTVYKIDFSTSQTYIVEIIDSIPSIMTESTSVSLKLGPDVWLSARSICKENERIVGWYHSHPGFGAFFSSTDKKTQKDFFNQPFNIGLVVDPFRKEEKWFFGKDSSRLQNLFFIKNRGHKK